MKANFALSFRCAAFPGSVFPRQLGRAVILVVILLILGPDQMEVIQLLLQR